MTAGPGSTGGVAAGGAEPRSGPRRMAIGETPAGADEEAARLRVAVVSDAIPGRNGVGTYYDDLVQHLRGRLGSIHLIAPPDSDDGVGPQPDDGVGPQPGEAAGPPVGGGARAESDGRGAASAIGWRLAMPGDPTQSVVFPRPGWLHDRLLQAAPDVVVAPTPGPFGLLAMYFAHRVGARFCVAYHTEFPKLAELYWRRFGLGWLMRRVGGAVDRMMFRSAAAVLVLNQRLRDSVRERGVADAPLMGTPTSPDFLSRPLRPLGERLGSVTFVGRLAPEKEVGQVLEVARTMPELRVRIVGDGPLRSEVGACAARRANVEWSGWVSRDDVLEVLDDSDLAVLPSRRETFGTAAFEAMVRRRPTLVSRGCGIAAWPDLRPGLFLMDDGERLVDAVARIRGFGAGERRRVAREGRAAAVELSARTVDHWVRVLADVAARRAVR